MGKRKQEKGRIYDITQWNKMKEELKNNLIMESTIEDARFIEQLIHDVQITIYDRRPGWHPYSDEVMKKKIEGHYKRMGENVYKKVSAAIEEINNQVDTKRQRVNNNSTQDRTTIGIGGKKRGKSRRRMRGKHRRKKRTKRKRKR